jgi:hypothetical protein
MASIQDWRCGRTGACWWMIKVSAGSLMRRKEELLRWGLSTGNCGGGMETDWTTQQILHWRRLHLRDYICPRCGAFAADDYVVDGHGNYSVLICSNCPDYVPKKVAQVLLGE